MSSIKRRTIRLIQLLRSDPVENTGIRCMDCDIPIGLPGLMPAYRVGERRAGTYRHNQCPTRELRPSLRRVCGLDKHDTIAMQGEE